MQYYQSIIYAHRPWMSKHALQPQPPRGPGYRHARGMCVRSAIAITNLLGIYEMNHGMRNIHHSAVHVASSAAVILLFADVCSHPDWKQQDIRAHLSICFRALEEFAGSWQSARQATHVIHEIQTKWWDRRMSSPVMRRMPPLNTASDGRSATDHCSLDVGSNLSSTWAQDDATSGESILFDPEIDWSMITECVPSMDSDANTLNQEDQFFAAM
jgi:hypothetical protein